MAGHRLKPTILQSFTGKILLLGLVAGAIPLLSMFLSISLFSQSLLKDFSQYLSDLQAREGQRLENQQQKLLHQQMRQKALDVAQDISEYLRNHPGKTWEELQRDPDFRDIATQPVGRVGETFLLADQEKKILVHSRRFLEGQTLAKALCLQGQLKEPVELQYGGTGGIQEFSLPRGLPQGDFCHGFLVPLQLQPSQGPQLMVGAWVDIGELDLIMAQPRAILKTAINLSRSLIETRMRQFQTHQLLLLAALGLLAVGASLALVRRLTGQVAALAQAAEAFDRGELNYRIRKPGKDELGQLARTLNRMAASLDENTISRLEWENTFNVLPDPIILMDREGRITRLNRSAVVALGVLPHAALGRHVSEVEQSSEASLSSSILVHALEHGLQNHMEFCTENGYAFLVTVDPCWDRQGEVSGMVFVAREITALKQMQKDVARASHFLEQIIEAAPLGLVFINREGIITRTNPQICQDFGFSPEDLLNHHYSQVYYHDHERLQVLAELRHKGEVLGRQVMLVNSGKEPVPARLSIRKLYGEGGGVLGSVSLVSNISEEISLQRQLEQAQKQEVVATLAGGLAHNFNNLLTIIMGLTSLMLAKIPQDHPAFADLLDIERQVRAGREITRKLLSFRRAADLESQPVDLNQLAAATADMFARTRQELVVHKVLASDLPAVEINSSQLQQVLMNLLINAWQAMPQGGEITLETRAVEVTDWQDQTWDLKPGPYVCLSVSDTGIGMSPETIAHLFDPFFTTKEVGEGSGLGLASAFRIMKNHRGAIQVASKPGEGSAFTLFLAASTACPQTSWPEDRRLILGEGTILVVDDDPILRRVAQNLLKKLGYRVLEAGSGEEAVELYRERGPEIDLVLLDVVMPGLNGWQTLERLRTVDANARVLLCSGLAENDQQAYPLGVGFIPKPYPLEILSQKVAQALNH